MRSDARPVTTGDEILANSDLMHLVCCCTNDNLSCCGLDMSAEPWATGSEDRCVVCHEMWPPGANCPLCGCEEC